MSGTRVRVGGPREPFRDGIEAELAAQGYSEGRAGQLMLLVAHLSRSLGERGVDCGELTVEVVG
jgi:hypothetical protein